MEPVWILAVFILGLSSGKEASFWKLTYFIMYELYQFSGHGYAHLNFSFDIENHTNQQARSDFLLPK